MWFILTAIVLGLVLFVTKETLFTRPSKKRKTLAAENAELLRVLLNLSDEARDELFQLYRKQFGASAAHYARKTYLKWKAGTVKPNKETFRRFLLHLPHVMTFDLKCEVLRVFRAAYCERDNYALTVYTDDWKEQITPLVETIVRKANEAELPQSLQRRLRWLAEDDVEIANALLLKSQEVQSRSALTLLDAEFANIQYLLDNAHGTRKVSHELKLPLGTINLNIKRR